MPVWNRAELRPAGDARLVDALTSRTGLLVIHLETEIASAWLTEKRVECAIREALMGPTEVEDMVADRR